MGTLEGVGSTGVAARFGSGTGALDGAAAERVDTVDEEGAYAAAFAGVC
jgi:hypothetical protein